jgi:hypothetical protein
MFISFMTGGGLYAPAINAKSQKRRRDNRPWEEVVFESGEMAARLAGRIIQQTRHFAHATYCRSLQQPTLDKRQGRAIGDDEVI